VRASALSTIQSYAGIVNLAAGHILWYHRRHNNSIILALLQLRRRPARTGDKWHLDQVFLKINRKLHYVWRAVDQPLNLLDILVHSRPDKRAAKKFFRKLLKGSQYVPGVLISDKLASYGAAQKQRLPNVEHRQHKRLNNRAENSQRPTGQRERVMRRFKSAGHAQRFLAAQGPIREHFCPGRDRLGAKR